MKPKPMMIDALSVAWATVLTVMLPLNGKNGLISFVEAVVAKDDDILCFKIEVDGSVLAFGSGLASVDFHVFSFMALGR